jgi:hypothetical protein
VKLIKEEKKLIEQKIRESKEKDDSMSEEGSPIMEMFGLMKRKETVEPQEQNSPKEDKDQSIENSMSQLYTNKEERDHLVA